jgi:hypothetical protein
VTLSSSVVLGFSLTVPVLPGPPRVLPSFASLMALLQASQPEGWRLWLATLTDIALVIIALALVITAAVFLGIALMVRKLLKMVDPLLTQVRTHVDPVMGHMRDVGENVNYMSSAIRADVQQVTELIDSTRRRLNRTTETAEQRVREFNALLGVMQEEAERLFIDSASTAAGVRAGTRAYRQARGGERELEIKVEQQ